MKEISLSQTLEVLPVLYNCKINVHIQIYIQVPIIAAATKTTSRRFTVLFQETEMRSKSVNGLYSHGTFYLSTLPL